MDPKPRLFVSHASNHHDADHRVVRVRDALCQQLSESWDVFLDVKSIPAGSRWRADVLAHLAAAQAAVILFDKQATRVSKWVPAEALILCFKKSLDPGFQLQPVLFDGLKLKDTCFDRYEPFQLNEVSALEDKPQLDAATFAGKIAACLNPRTAALATRRGWIEDACEIVKDNERALLLAAEQLEIELSRLNDLDTRRTEWCTGARRAVVQHLHQHQRLAECLSAVEDLMRPMNAEDRGRFASYLYAKWVPNEAAEILLNAARNPAKRGLLAINSGEHDVARHYTERVRIEMSPIKVSFASVSSATGEDDEAMIHAVCLALQQSLKLRRKMRDPKTQQPLSERESIALLTADPDRLVICLLPSRFARASLTASLRKTFGNVLFLLGAENAADSAEVRSTGASLLTPLLDATLLNDLTKLETWLDGDDIRTNSEV